MHHVPGKDRNKPISISLEQLVHPQSFARIIDAFVDVMDLESFGFSYFQLNEEGRPPYHPAIMMKLYLYGYKHGLRYTKRTDTYTCPAGHILRTNGKSYHKKLANGRKSYAVKYYKTDACQGCPLRAECTTNKRGRTIERSEYQEYITQNNKRVNKNPEYYWKRQQLIEHQFGTLKRQRGFDYTLLRGKDKVLAEVSLSFICYNLGRTVSILGFSKLMRRIKALLCEKYSTFLFLAVGKNQRRESCTFLM